MYLSLDLLLAYDMALTVLMFLVSHSLNSLTCFRGQVAGARRRDQTRWKSLQRGHSKITNDATYLKWYAVYKDEACWVVRPQRDR